MGCILCCTRGGRGEYALEAVERRSSDHFCIFSIFMNLVYWSECAYERKHLFCYFGLYRRMWFHRACSRFLKHLNTIRTVRANLTVCLWVLSTFSNNIRLRSKHSTFNKRSVDPLLEVKPFDMVIVSLISGFDYCNVV